MAKKLVTLYFDEKYYELVRDVFDHYYDLSDIALLKNVVNRKQHTFTGIDCSTDGQIVYRFTDRNMAFVEKRINDLYDAGILNFSIIERA